jgi:membrane protein DedA with SNARE-associated domain
MEALVNFFLDVIHKAGYPGLFFVMVLGNIGIPVGTEIVVPAAGALAQEGHLPSVFLVGLIATAGEIVGAGLLYAAGFFGGRPFVARYGKYVALSTHKLDIAHGFYEKYGTPMVFVGRFIPLIRGIASLPAGISQMPKRYFFTYTALGSAIWCFGFAYAGAMFDRHLDDILPLIHRFSVLIVAVVLVAAVAGLVFWNRKRKPTTP